MVAWPLYVDHVIVNRMPETFDAETFLLYFHIFLMFAYIWTKCITECDMMVESYFSLLVMISEWSFIFIFLCMIMIAENIIMKRGRDSSVGKSSAFQAGNPGSNPGGGLTWAPNACMRGEEIISCKSHIASVCLTDWCIMSFKNISLWTCSKCPLYITYILEKILHCTHKPGSFIFLSH